MSMMQAGPSRPIAAAAAAAKHMRRQRPCRSLLISSFARESPCLVAPALGARGMASKPPSNRIAKERYNFNTGLDLEEDPDPDHIHYPRVTAKELSSRREPPKRVKMLVRDFIDDSLYNPHYGYFSRNATIFTPPSTGFDISQLADAAAFQEAVASRYDEYEAQEEALVAAAASNGKGKGKAADMAADGRGKGGLGRQVWHTPTELFKPYYAQSLIKAILKSYKLNHFPHQNLVIYEVGAGNGSFMIDSLLYLREHEPAVFERTKYRIIEISPQLATIQKRRAKEAGLQDQVEVINEDVFRWDGGTKDPCFVVALEVFDNFSHDMVRYNLSDLSPMQAVVSIDASGDFTLLYEPLNDPLLRRVMDYRRLLYPSPATQPLVRSRILQSPILRKLYNSMPFAANLSAPDFIPSKAVLFLERLRERLPGHRLLVADFDELPDAVEGRNGPVVQTRYGGTMVPCETFLVKQGYFDIFFPTDFELLRDTYSLIMNSPVAQRQTAGNTLNRDHSPIAPNFFSSTGVKGFRRRQVSIYGHAEFLAMHGGQAIVDATKTRDGESVMLGMYKNAKFMF